MFALANDLVGLTIEKVLPQEGWFVLAAIAPGAGVREMARQAGLPTLRESRGCQREELSPLRG